MKKFVGLLRDWKNILQTDYTQQTFCEVVEWLIS